MSMVQATKTQRHKEKPNEACKGKGCMKRTSVGGRLETCPYKTLITNNKRFILDLHE